MFKMRSKNGRRDKERQIDVSKENCGKIASAGLQRIGPYWEKYTGASCDSK